MEIEIYDGDELHGVATQKVSTILKSVDMRAEMIQNLKDDPTANFSGFSTYPLFNGSKPAGLLQIQYVFKPALHGNTFEKGVDAEYAVDKHDHVFEEAKLLKHVRPDGCFSCGCCVKYTCATAGCLAATATAVTCAQHGRVPNQNDVSAFKTFISSLF